MDSEEMAEARQRAQDALSRARLASDPATKKEWQDLANVWLARIKKLEADAGKAKPRRAG